MDADGNAIPGQDPEQEEDEVADEEGQEGEEEDARERNFVNDGHEEEMDTEVELPLAREVRALAKNLKDVLLASDVDGFKQPRFTGSGGENFLDFLRLFYMYCDAKDWKVDRQTARFPWFLGKSAFNFYWADLDDGIRADLSKVVEAFKNKYCSSVAKYVMRIDLSNLVQKPDESVQTYFDSFNKKAAKIELPAAERMQMIIRGLKPAIRKFVLQRAPTTMGELESGAKLGEIIMGIPETTASASVNMVSADSQSDSDLRSELVDIKALMLDQYKRPNEPSRSNFNDRRPRQYDNNWDRRPRQNDNDWERRPGFDRGPRFRAQWQNDRSGRGHGRPMNNSCVCDNSARPGFSQNRRTRFDNNWRQNTSTCTYCNSNNHTKYQCPVRHSDQSGDRRFTRSSGQGRSRFDLNGKPSTY